MCRLLPRTYTVYEIADSRTHPHGLFRPPCLILFRENQKHMGTRYALVYSADGMALACGCCLSSPGPCWGRDGDQAHSCL
jgi:hypothetical protein